MSPNFPRNVLEGDNDLIPQETSPFGGSKERGLSPQSPKDDSMFLLMNQSQSLGGKLGASIDKRTLNLSTSYINNSSKANGSLDVSKHMLLYEDAQYRDFRQKHIYDNTIDKECTFKPELATKKSTTSKNTVKAVQQEVQDRIYQTMNQGKLNMSTISAGHYSQNRSVLTDQAVNTKRSPANTRLMYLSH